MEETPMKHYQTEEFLYNSAPTTLADEVEKTISVLYELCILTKHKAGHCDPREDALRKLLLSRSSVTSMHNCVHDLKTGRCTLNRLLAQNMLN
jgi:hypothetical protein